nr:MAG TPA: hypothetical protein [Caudoviricetes sp.]
MFTRASIHNDITVTDVQLRTNYYSKQLITKLAPISMILLQFIEHTYITML